ncbi:DinB family protein [Fluviicola sp.]|uniref:DinB family protein n=1 Tax=Fluviicola sp. TaxID=1917219 RepID=UPI0031DBAF88
MNPEFERAFEKDLNTLAQEITLCDETQLWEVLPGITNSIGNLAQHLVGNLNHFIGATLGDTGYVRNRSAEFEERSFNKEELIHQIQTTAAMVVKVIASLSPEQLKAVYPYETFGYPMSCEHKILKLSNHLGYHLGQINYLRRITSSQK